MTLQIEFWQLMTFLVGLLLGFLSFAYGVGKSFLARLDKNFEEQMRALFELSAKTENNLDRLERDFLRFQADLPLHYVRREDYVRGQSVIEAKLDAVMSELKVVQIQGAQQHG